MKRTTVLLALSWLLYATPCRAQSSSGTEFWLAYMENLTLLFNDDPVFAIHISSGFTTSGLITVPATGYSQAFSVNAGEQLEVLLPNAIWYAETSDVVVGKGIRITADLPIEVMATHFRLFFTESTGVLPESELGNDYLVTCFFGAGSLDPPSSFVVVATADATEVEIIPAALTTGLHPAGTPYTVILDEGDIYQVQALDDLTGSRVSTPNGEKIAVFSGARQSYVGFNCSNPADNHLWEQSQPFSNWSDLYYFVPFKFQGGDFVRILAQGDATQVFFDCEPVTVLQAGEYYDTSISQPTVITSTGLVAVTQFNESQECNASGIGDPSMLQLLPTRNQAFYARWRATPGTTGSSSVITQHFTNIMMRTGDTDAIQLDGNSIENQFFPFPADTSYAYAQVSVPGGDHELQSSAPFHAYHYGFGDYDAYAKTGNYQQKETLDFSCEMECMDLLPVNIVMNLEQCLGQVYTAVLETTAELVTYQWFLDGQAVGNNAPVFQAEPLSVGLSTLYLLAADGDGCEYEAAVTFNVDDCEDDCLFPPESVQIVAIADLNLCPGDTLLYSFDTELTLQSVFWEAGDGRTFTDSFPAVPVLEAGDLSVFLTAVDENGCFYYDSVTTIIGQNCGDPCQVYVPNAFSPNDDGVNDHFKPLSNCVPESFELKLFDRWGGLVFETGNFDQSWDGKLKGQPLPSGVFTWYIKYSFTGQDIETKAGDLVIVR